MIFQLKCLFTDKMGVLQMAPDTRVPRGTQKRLSPTAREAPLGKAQRRKRRFIVFELVISFPPI